MNVRLVIDTTSNQEVTVGLQMGTKNDIRTEKLDYRRAQIVLPLIEELLHKHHLKFGDITTIEVNQGPGSFTGIRVGVTIANTLGFLLDIPINGKKVKEFIEPIYVV